MKNSTDPIFIIAGEVSGDIFAAELMHQINSIEPTRFIGFGGIHMQKQNLELLAEDNSLLSSIGLFEGLSFLWKQAMMLNKIVPAIKKNKIKQVILVDHEVFSILAAKKIKKQFGNTVQIYFFIPPRVSMWGAKNAPKIAELCDALFCYMEPDLSIYQKYNTESYFFGNPLSKKLKTFVANHHFFEKHHLDPHKEYIALMAGSRKQEIKKLLPIFLQTAERLHKEHNIEFLMTIAHEGLKPKILEEINKTNIAHAIHILKESSLDIMSHVNIGLVSAGTITLESVMMKMYPIISYKLSNFTFNMLRKSENLPDDTLIGLPNVFLKDRLFPELLQDEVNSDRLYDEVIFVRNFNKESFEYFMHQVSEKLGQTLGSTNVFEKVASYILEKRENLF